MNLAKNHFMHRTKRDERFILWFSEIDNDDVGLVGGKNASLGEMYQTLGKEGVRIPNGFAITAHAYRYLLQQGGIGEEMHRALRGLKISDVIDLATRGAHLRELIKSCDFPKELEESIRAAYRRLCREYGKDADVAVRSSATAEDLPTASFAGQQETFLNIRGEDGLLEACKNCFASLFTNRAISYRVDKGFDHFKIALSIGVQKMVRSDLACSGVMFTLDTETGFKDVIIIDAAYGLGENVVQGIVNPDEYHVFKPTLRLGYKPILAKKLGAKEQKMIYASTGKKPTKNVPVSQHERENFAINDEEILQLAHWGAIIEDHYTKRNGHLTPMDIEWAKDGESGKLFIVQARPETVKSQQDITVYEEFDLKQKGKLITKGIAISNKIATGRAHIINDVKDLHKFKPGEVLVTNVTDPDWEPIMKIAAAIVTNHGGKTSHAAIVSRELGITCIVGCGDATEKIKDGQKITVSCAEGEEGKVYEGFLKYQVTKHDLKKIPRTRTQILMNLGNPDQAYGLSFLPHKGIGLAREEFIINSYIKIHPMALIQFNTLKDQEAKQTIADLTATYKDKRQFFVDKLAQGIGTLASSVYPHDIIVRLSDFKTNEYANLIGGKEFEPKEENPMIGWRGASRYYSDRFKEAFALECQAIKKTRDIFGLHNIKVMIPVCRTPEEGKRVIAEMAKNGLVQHKDHLEVYVMCEVPSNVILAEEFCKIFDGFSIGSNDLTQTTLAVDRDSELVSHLFDERNEAVKRMVSHVIAVARKHNKKIGICGDAPSTFPEFATFLVDCGIDSISLSPDAVIRTILHIAQHEKKIGNKVLNKGWGL